MPPVGFETWYPKHCHTVFTVRNICTDNRLIHVFHYPIPPGKQRDLMEIPYVSEADIRHSLLKGELYIKLICRDIRVVDSTIDLIQFDACHKNFLQEAGITIGLDAGGGGGGQVDYLFRQNVQLIGPKNDANRVFMTPFGEKFINDTFEDNDFRIIVEHNGRRLIEDIDYTVLESMPGLGYDMVRFDSFVPNKRSQIIADYVIKR
jgi:hypothetical protein